MKSLPLLFLALLSSCASVESSPETAPAWVEKALSARERAPLVESQAKLFVGTYRETLSRVDGPTCRFRPTCSGFAEEALSTYGAWGIALTFARIQRAHVHDIKRYESHGREVHDPLSAHAFWFDASHQDWHWYHHVESIR